MSTADNDAPYDGSEIRVRTLECKQLLEHSASSIPNITGVEWFESRQAEFNLWSRTMSATAQYKPSLDHRLRDHPEMRELVCSLLDGLAEAIDDLLQLAGSDSYLATLTARSDSDEDVISVHSESEHSSSEDEPSCQPGDHDENIGDLSLTGPSEVEAINIQKFFVKVTISQLASLSTEIRGSGTKYSHLKADASLVREDYNDNIRSWVNEIICDRISYRDSASIPPNIENPGHPDPGLLTVVQNRLIDANLRRLHRIMFNKKVAEGHRGRYSPIEHGGRIPAKPYVVGEGQTEQEQTELKQKQHRNTVTTPGAYTATEYGSQMVAPNINRVAAPSDASRATRRSQGHLEYPMCPPLEEGGTSLECPYCFEILPSECQKNTVNWRQHVSEDILPYVCYYERCETPDAMYSSSNDLMAHIDADHSHSVWFCTQCDPQSKPGCSPLVFHDLQRWEEHMHHQHSYTSSLAELQILAQACKGRTPDSVMCPLCTHESAKHVAADENHIIWHIHQFSLKCLSDYKENGFELDQKTDEADTIISQERIHDEVDEEQSVVTPQKESKLVLTTTESDHPESGGFLHSMAISRALTKELFYSGTLLLDFDHIFDTYFAVDADTTVSPDTSTDLNHPTLKGSTQLEQPQSAFDGASSALSAVTVSPPRSYSPRFEVPLDHPVRGSDEDLHGLLRFDDKLTTPECNIGDLPRPTKLDIAGHTKPARSRVIQDVVKANSVRDPRCMRCRIQRVSCSDQGICATCVKACPEAADICCNRKDFVTVARECSSRRFAGLTHKNDDIVKEILRCSRLEFGAHAFKGQIFLDRSCTGASLPACLRNYTYKTVGTDTITHAGCTFSRSDPNPALLQGHQLEWTERSLSPEDFSTFEGGIECLIKAYVRLGYARQRPQVSLLEKVHIFKSAYKICRAQTLFFVQPSGKGVEELPLPAQAELRGVARAALESSERYILSELDKYLKTPKISDQDRPAVWAALWQLMFVYRNLLRNVQPWRNNAEALFNAVAVFYATLFRTKAALKSLDEVESAWLPNDAQRHDLVGAFNQALSLRDTFYQSIVAGIASIDERLKILVVDPEMKVLNRRATTKKPAGAKRGAAHGHDGDEVMGGC